MIHVREKVERKENIDDKLNRLPVGDTQRVQVLLAAEGLKRATNLDIPFATELPEIRPISSREEMRLSVTRTRQILRTMGLRVAQMSGEMTSQDQPYWREENYTLCTARKQEDAERLAQLLSKKEQTYEISQELGTLFGFPPTAIEAYASSGEDKSKAESLMYFFDLPLDVQKEDAVAFIWFRLSKEHWQEEMETVRRWAEAVKRRAPALYMRCVEEYRHDLEKAKSL